MLVILGDSGSLDKSFWGKIVHRGSYLRTPFILFSIRCFFSILEGLYHHPTKTHCLKGASVVRPFKMAILLLSVYPLLDQPLLHSHDYPILLISNYPRVCSLPQQLVSLVTDESP